MSRTALWAISPPPPNRTCSAGPKEGVHCQAYPECMAPPHVVVATEIGLLVSLSLDTLARVQSPACQVLQCQEVARPKGPFRTKNATALSSVVFYYRRSFLLSVAFAAYFPLKKSGFKVSAVVFYYRGSEFTTDSIFTIRSGFSTGSFGDVSGRAHTVKIRAPNSSILPVRKLNPKIIRDETHFRVTPAACGNSVFRTTARIYFGSSQ